MSFQCTSVKVSTSTTCGPMGGTQVVPKEVLGHADPIGSFPSLKGTKIPERIPLKVAFWTPTFPSPLRGFYFDRGPLGGVHG